MKLALRTTLYAPGDPMGKMLFNVVATFAEFEGDLIRLRTREGMAIARAKGKLRGKQPKLSDKQQKELCRMHESGQYSISDLAELFSVSRPTVYRTLLRGKKIDLTAEQRQLAKIVHDYASRFPQTADGDTQLLQGCYDYMDAFKRVMDSSSKVQMDYICLQYPGYFRFAKWMERLAQGIADGAIEVPKDH